MISGGFSVTVYKDVVLGSVGKNVSDLSQSYVYSDRTVEKSREKSREKIINIIQLNKNITQKEIAESLGLSIKGIEKNILKLKAEGVLKRIGPDKGGYWEIINKKEDKI